MASGRILHSGDSHGRGVEKAPRPILAMKAAAIVFAGLLLGPGSLVRGRRRSQHHEVAGCSQLKAFHFRGRLSG
jgi:hypothetical protein